MPKATIEATKVELEYETFGEPTDPPLLLVMGLGAQLTLWDEGFCQRLADGGRYVIRYDNRDIGLSTNFDDSPFDLGALFGVLLGGDPSSLEVPYKLSDLAADAVGLLDALGIQTAHIVGASMGGMIAQTIAIEHPTRVRTLTSIMSNTGESDLGQPTEAAMAALMTPPPAERGAYIEHALAGAKVISSPRYFDAERTRQTVERDYDRSFHPEGTVRQLAAIIASGSRADGLRNLRVPTLVIHGRPDPLVQVSGGERTAELVPSANLLILNDMAHDLPEPLWPLVTDTILSHTTYAIG
jgi:pimeloyl-ACP methyl ester carboxylesterase